jgi:hypothetical protein
MLSRLSECDSHHYPFNFFSDTHCLFLSYSYLFVCYLLLAFALTLINNCANHEIMRLSY